MEVTGTVYAYPSVGRDGRMARQLGIDPMTIKPVE